ncbi:hypothetical protein [Sorangium sp. So ce363]|uniref:hypothetical protein n=1 Tax=Sorangium sp. So ce363 TaxID=3133304 RepID=UPI003F623CB4
MSGPIEAYKRLPGMLLASMYRLHRKIGQGTMGVVWAATNEATGRGAQGDRPTGIPRCGSGSCARRSRAARFSTATSST